MAKIDPVTTRGGDLGETSLTDGSRIRKDSQRVNAYGTVDELNSVIGLVRCEALSPEIKEKLLQLQNQLFNLGGELATPIDSELTCRIPRIQQAHIDRVEEWVDEANQQLEAAHSFILPGGNRAAATLHLARTVARRCEREVVALIEAGDEINPCCLKFLNRLSDLFFVWARFCNDRGKADIRWRSEHYNE